MKKIIALVALLLMPDTTGSEEANISELLPKHFEARKAILSNLGVSIPMQFSVFPSYSACLFTAWEQGLRENNEAHTTFLNQIDLLAEEGASIESIVSLVSYGHSIANQTYANSKKIPLNKVDASHLNELSIYFESVFDSKLCRKYFYDSTFQGYIKSLVGNFTNKK